MEAKGKASTSSPSSSGIGVTEAHTGSSAYFPAISRGEFGYQIRCGGVRVDGCAKLDSHKDGTKGGGIELSP